jgi:hypothetical protein
MPRPLPLPPPLPLVLIKLTNYVCKETLLEMEVNVTFAIRAILILPPEFVLPQPPLLPILWLIKMLSLLECVL